MAHPQSSFRGLWAKNRIDLKQQQLTGNSTGIVWSGGPSSLPGNVDNGKLIGVISNSTGVALFINTTGTTHKYLNVTSAQPT